MSEDKQTAGGEPTLSAKEETAAAVSPKEALAVVTGKVLVPVRDKDGQAVRDDKGRPRVQQRRAGAADILSAVRRPDGSVCVVTVDGRRWVG